ncbi:hypothetical protein [Streptomyces sp. MMS24-I29]|uniref:hypothetical protein n=1 Tax=Streptomyces sp. MMS24-I29 TaxID=3351480 RepID=UPI003C7B7126
MAVVTRSSGSARTLFQSDLRHQETITLRITAAERKRSLHQDWVYPRERLVEIEMSLAQWGALVSSVGLGSGVPVTLRSTESRPDVPHIPHEPRIAENVDEVKNAVNRLLAQVKETFAGLEEAIAEKKGIRVIREALGRHRASIANAASNSAFAVTSLAEAAEHVTAQAKADIEAHVLAAARLTGLGAPVHVPEIGAEGAQEVGP